MCKQWYVFPFLALLNYNKFLDHKLSFVQAEWLLPKFYERYWPIYREDVKFDYNQGQSVETVLHIGGFRTEIHTFLNKLNTSFVNSYLQPPPINAKTRFGDIVTWLQHWLGEGAKYEKCRQAGKWPLKGKVCFRTVSQLLSSLIVALNIDVISRTEGFILETSTDYLLVSNWFTYNKIWVCSNFYEKFQLHRRIFATVPRSTLRRWNTKIHISH